MNLQTLKPAKGSTKSRKRIGRGSGSGKGGTSTRGHKGAKSRSGYSQKKGFEGGQMPLQRRIPKFGFKNINRVEYKGVNLDLIQNLLDTYKTDIIDVEYLKKHGIVGNRELIKVLGRGELKSNVEIKVHAFSKTATEAIEKAGGKATVIK